MGLLQALIDEARAEYRRNEMEDPVLLDGTSEMHAERALRHLQIQKWDEALKEANVAAQQRNRWTRLLEIVRKVHEAAGLG